jgi:neutral amino acid transport system ATP-binding protein
LVEQNARKALEMAHRGYVLESGRDAIQGPGLELLNDPKVGELYLGAGKAR